MKTILVYILFFSTVLWADLRHMDANIDVVKSGVKIIDIRTEPEWKETGLVENSIPITFLA